MSRPFCPAPRAVVFDLDGTLVDSMPLVLKAFAHALEPYCPPMDSQELFLRLGAPPERTFHALLGGAENVPAAMARLVEFSTANWRLIRPFQGMAELLTDLRDRSLPLAVWTGRERVSTEWIFREQSLNAWFPTLVCGDDLPSHKPDPAGLSEILKRLDRQPEEVLFVGDADVDVVAGAALGVRTLLIRHARSVQPAVLKQAWRVVDTPAQAYDAVRAAVGGRLGNS